MTAVPTSWSVAACSSTCWHGAQPPISSPLLAQLDVDLVVYEQYDFGAAVAAHAVGISVVCHSLSPRLPAEVIERFARLPLERLWSEHGVDSPRWTCSPAMRTSTSSQPCCSSRRSSPNPARMPMRSIPFAEPGAVVPSWIGVTDRPLVYLTLGTIVATDEVLEPVIDGLSALDADVLVALGSADGAELGTLPANVHIEPFVNQPAVLDLADLAVHHGGSGTLLAALAAAFRSCCCRRGPTSSSTPTSWRGPDWRLCSSQLGSPPDPWPPQQRTPCSAVGRRPMPFVRRWPRCPARTRCWSSSSPDSVEANLPNAAA